MTHSRVIWLIGSLSAHIIGCHLAHSHIGHDSLICTTWRIHMWWWISHTYIRTYLPPDIHTYLHTSWHTYVRTYLLTYIRTYLPSDIRTYLPTFWHTYVHASIHTYIHAYAYIHKRMSSWGLVSSDICQDIMISYHHMWWYVGAYVMMQWWRVQFDFILIKRTPPPGGVSYLVCSLIKTPEEEDPPRST